MLHETAWLINHTTTIRVRCFLNPIPLSITIIKIKVLWNIILSSVPYHGDSTKT